MVVQKLINNQIDDYESYIESLKQIDISGVQSMVDKIYAYLNTDYPIQIEVTLEGTSFTIETFAETPFIDNDWRRTYEYVCDKTDETYDAFYEDIIRMKYAIYVIRRI